MNIIKLQLADWLYNAGIVGFINIIKHNDEEIILNGQEVEFNEEVLENFEEKYFNYFIDTYEKTLSWYKIISFEEFIIKHENDDFKNFDKNALEHLNNYIGTGSKSGSIKYYLNSKSYQAAYSLIDKNFDILKELKNLNKINLKKDEKIDNKISEVKSAFSSIKHIISYCKSEKGRKYIAGKNVIYNIISNALKGVSFLNSQPKIKDMYVDYKEYFVTKAKHYMKLQKQKYKYDCFICNSKINNLNNSLSFMNSTGFDINKKSSHVWNFTNDIAICDICRLIYSCVPAGFTYLYDKGIYINENHNVEHAVNINKKIKHEILNIDESKGIYNAFGSLIIALKESVNKSTVYEFADIQVVKFEESKYKFNLLSKNLLKVLRDSTHELDSLIKANFKEVETYFRLYDETMKKLLNNENLFILIYKAMIIKISKPKNAHFNVNHINNLLRVNTKYLKGVGVMENTEKDYVKSANGAGYYLKEAYKQKKSENKLDGISYRLLNALKTNNKHMFMDTLLNCYLYTHKTVPQLFTDCLKDDYVFKTVGYAFVSGLIDSKKNENLNGGENNG